MKNTNLDHGYAVVVQDLETQWVHSYPSKTKSAQETQRCPRKILRPEENQRSIYIDRFFFQKSAKSCIGTMRDQQKQMGLQSELYDGPSSVVVQLGLQESWWAEAEWYC